MTINELRMLLAAPALPGKHYNGNEAKIIAAVPELLDSFESALQLIALCSEDYNNTNFTDRHETGPRLTAFLRKHRR